jgi:hypothetical protein
MFWKVAPSVLPVGTVTLPPAMIAVTMRLRSVGFGSIWASRSLISMIDPCEWPMKMTGAPSS